MNEDPPKGLAISDRVKWRMERDETCIRDAMVFKSKFGEFPHGMARRKEWKTGKKFNPKAKVSHTSEIKKRDKVMLAENEFFKGQAVWKYEVGIWACASADDCLSFLLKKSVKDAQLELTRRGFSWEWI